MNKLVDGGAGGCCRDEKNDIITIPPMEGSKNLVWADQPVPHSDQPEWNKCLHFNFSFRSGWKNYFIFEDTLDICS